MRGMGRVALRVAIGYLALLCLMAGVGVLGVRAINNAATATMDLQTHPFTVINAVGDAERGISNIAGQIMAVLAYPDDEPRDALPQAVADAAAEVEKSIAVIEERYLGPRADLQVLQAGWRRWKDTANILTRSITDDDLDSARSLYYRQGGAEFAAAAGACRPILDYARTKSWIFVNASAASRDAMVAMVWRLLAAALLIGVGVAILVTRSFTRPLARLRGAISRLGQGVLESPTPETGRRDEIGEIARTLEAFRQTLLDKKALELKYLTVFNSCPDVIAVSDRETGVLIEVNNAFESVAGFTRAEAVGRSGVDIGMWGDDSQRRRMMVAMSNSSRLLNYEATMHRKGGAPFTALLSVELVELAGRPCLIFVARDISDRKREEDLLRRTNTELEQSNHILERFAHAAAHDLQEPCRTVCSYTQLLERECAGMLSENGQEYLSFISSGAHRMRDLVRGLLVYSQTRRGTSQADVATASVVEEALADVGDIRRATGAAVVYGDLPTVHGDAGQLQLLFAALIGNAIKFHKIGQPPQVRIAAARHNADWLFTVVDNGVGIAHEYLEKVFEAFQRLHSHALYPGAGIGLALAKRIVETHGGRIWAESELDAGTTIYFTLPLRPADAPAPGSICLPNAHKP